VARLHVSIDAMLPEVGPVTAALVIGVKWRAVELRLARVTGAGQTSGSRELQGRTRVEGPARHGYMDLRAHPSEDEWRDKLLQTLRQHRVTRELANSWQTI
jgi:hypothetical protein